MNRHRVIMICCLLLTAAALARTYSLQRDRRALEEDMVILRQATFAPVPAETPSPLPPEAPAPSVPDAVSAAPTPAAAVEAVVPPADRELTEAREEIERLRFFIGQRDQTLAEVQEQAAKRDAEQESRRRFRAERGAEAMERLQREDPARYAEIQKQQAEFRERLAANVGNQQTFLSQVDVSAWPVEMRENHEKLLETIGKFNAAMNRAGTPPEGETREARRQLFRDFQQTREMFEKEREMLLHDTAKQMGFDEEGSRQFVEYIHTIQNVTSWRGMFDRRDRSSPPRDTPSAEAR